jgi:hypothetical protein
MKISLKPQHLKFYQQIAALLFRYGRSDLVSDLTTSELLDEKEIKTENGTASPEQLADDLEAMATSAVRLLSDAELHARIAEAACRRVRKEFCVERVVPMYEKCYEDAM